VISLKIPFELEIDGVTKACELRISRDTIRKLVSTYLESQVGREGTGDV
jgi:hypothetical protein